MATKVKLPPLQQVLFKHFESHQHQSDENVVLSVAARVQIQQQLKELALNDAVNGLLERCNPFRVRRYKVASMEESRFIL
jgi:hypothetical protein